MSEITEDKMSGYPIMARKRDEESQLESVEIRNLDQTRRCRKRKTNCKSNIERSTHLKNNNCLCE